MDLQEAYKNLNLAVEVFVTAALLDDKTPLGNVMALTQAASTVGTGGENADVVVFADLNRFKSLNDQFGHAVGDVAISVVGQLILELIRKCGGKAFRRGGDDFVILLSKNRIEDFRRNLGVFEACTFKVEGKTYKTAVSFGYSVREGEVDYAALLDKAEVACRAAKSVGDGACVEWSTEVERKALINLRDRCKWCHAQITVNVPKETAPSGKRLLYCSCCGRSLSDSTN